MDAHRRRSVSDSHQALVQLHDWLYQTRRQLDAAEFAEQMFVLEPVFPRPALDWPSEEPTRLSATLFSVLLDHTCDGALLFTRGGEIVWANRHAAQRFGRSQRELLGTRLEPWLGSAGYARLYESLEAADGLARLDQLELHGGAGVPERADALVMCLGPTEYALCGLLLYEARAAEHERRLQESEHRLEVALKHSTILVSHCDCERRYTWIYSPTDHLKASRWLGRRDEEIMPLEQVAELVEFKQHVLASGIGARREVRSIGPEGEMFFDVTAEPLRAADGKIVGLTVAAINITDRKQAERQLTELSETLEQQIRVRTAEAEHRAQQLRALAAELTYAEQRERKRLAQMLHDHLQQLVVAAKMGIGRLRRQAGENEKESLLQIEQLLDETIQASRSLVVELSPPILHDAGLSEALAWLARSFEEKYGLRVAVQSDESIEPEAEDVKVFMFQAVRELLFNVVKHGQTDRAMLALARAAAEDQIAITVEDAGQGFAPHHADLDTRQQKFGLFSVRERLETLGGSLTIESAPGQGTRVQLFAPLRAARLGAAAAGLAEFPASESPANQPPTAGGLASEEPVIRQSDKIRVLIADDHKILRQGLISLLAEQSDLEVIGEAADGQEAVEQAHALQPDVVIMDVNMPRLNGIEATRQIKQHFPQAIVIGLSLHEEESMAATMCRAGAAAYMSKENQLGELCRTIRAACAGQKTIEHSN